jgi:8-oxo-dGTP diphosphatase
MSQQQTYTRKELENFDWSRWRPNQEAVLAFPLRDGQILLIEKKRGLGAGKVNGPGGKVDPGETPEEAVVRETEEEVCVRLDEIELAGILRFQFTDGLAIRCRVYRSEVFHGEEAETPEATPFWCDFKDIPYERMWKDDRFWIPLLLDRTYFEGNFSFDGESMIDFELIKS